MHKNRLCARGENADDSGNLNARRRASTSMTLHSTVATTIGAVTALITSAVQQAISAPPVNQVGSILLPTLAGVAGAAVTWGVMKAKIDGAHEKIATEKADREKALTELKTDINRGFDEIKLSLRDLFSIVNNRDNHTRTRSSDMT